MAIAPGETLELHVRVVEARGLHNRSNFSPMTTFVILRVGSLVLRSSDAVEAGTSPHWNYKFSGLAADPAGTAFINVIDKGGMMTDDHLLGSTQLSLASITDGSVSDVWLPLKKGEQERGEVRIRAQLMHQGERPIAPKDAGQADLAVIGRAVLAAGLGAVASAPPQAARPQPQPQYEQYAAPQDAAPQYAAPQYAAPQFAAPQYAAPQYAAPQYAAPQYAAPQYGTPQYAAPQYATPQYGTPPPPARYGAPPPPMTTLAPQYPPLAPYYQAFAPQPAPYPQPAYAGEDAIKARGSARSSLCFINYPPPPPPHPPPAAPQAYPAYPVPPYQQQQYYGAPY